MDSVRTTRYLLAVTTIAVTISLGCAAPVFGVNIYIPKKPANFTSSSLLEKSPLPQLPKITMNFNSENTHSPQPSETDCETSPDDEKQEFQPEPTVDEQRGGQDSHQSSENASQKTTVNPNTSTIHNQPDSGEEPPLDELTTYSPMPDNQETNVIPPPIKNPNIPYTPSQTMEGIREDTLENETSQPTPHNGTEKTENHLILPCESHKRPLSDASSLATLTSPPSENSNAERSGRSAKKTKVDRFRSNSLSKTAVKIYDWLKPAEDIFSNDSSISLNQFKYVLENFTNKNLNIHNICNDINSDFTTLMLLIDSV
ncbi:hypothetical protein QTP88_026835 [Uroleucon formosanum]